MQTTIDFDAIRAGIDAMFPVKAKATPKATPSDDLASIEARAISRIPARYQTDRYSREVIQWLGTIPAAVADTQAVTASPQNMEKWVIGIGTLSKKRQVLTILM